MKKVKVCIRPASRFEILATVLEKGTYVPLVKGRRRGVVMWEVCAILRVVWVLLVGAHWQALRRFEDVNFP